MVVAWYSHWPQGYFIFSCIALVCLFKLSLCVNRFSHRSQEYLTSSWKDWICSLRYQFCENVLLHWSHSTLIKFVLLSSSIYSIPSIILSYKEPRSGLTLFSSMFNLYVFEKDNLNEIAKKFTWYQELRKFIDKPNGVSGRGRDWVLGSEEQLGPHLGRGRLPETGPGPGTLRGRGTFYHTSLCCHNLLILRPPPCLTIFHLYSILLLTFTFLFILLLYNNLLIFLDIKYFYIFKNVSFKTHNKSYHKPSFPLTIFYFIGSGLWPVLF